MTTFSRRGLAKIWLLPLATALAFFASLTCFEQQLVHRCIPGFSRPLRYSVVDLGPMWPSAINDRGQVAGYAPTTGGRLHAVLWQSGKRTDLGTLPGFADSYALSLNATGQVTGYADDVGQGGDGTRRYRAFLWRDGRMQDLGSLPDHALSLGLGINAAGEVTGIALPSARPEDPNPHRVFLWCGGRMQDLGDFGDDRCVVLGINRRGQIAGQARRHAVLWEGGKVRDLGTLPGTSESAAFGLNERGQVVGYSGHAFLWEEGRLRDLGTLGGAQSLAAGINEGGQAVGVSQTRDGDLRAFLWDGSRLQDLNRLLPEGSPWVAQLATSINRQGQIVGVGERNGTFSAFLLTPG